MEVIGVLSLIFGIIGLISSLWYIGIIPCVVGITLGIIGLTDYLADKKCATGGLLASILGAVLSVYMFASDIDSGRLIVLYNGSGLKHSDITYMISGESGKTPQTSSGWNPGNQMYNETATQIVRAEPEESAVDNTVEQEWNNETTVIPESVSASVTEPSEGRETASASVEMSEPVIVEAPVSQTDYNSVEVHITRTGEKYHSAGCQYLSKSDRIVTLEQAKAKGLEPCSRCNPPQ